MILGLRTKIATVFALVLTLSGLVIGVVFLTLWRQDGILAQGEHLDDMLAIAVEDISEKSDLQQSDLQNFGLGTGQRCLVIVTPTFAETENYLCPQKNEIINSATQSIKSGQNTETIKTNGLLPLIFSGGVLTRCRYISFGGSSHAAVCVQERLGSTSREGGVDSDIGWAYLTITVIVFTIIGFFRMVRLVVSPIEELAGLCEKIDGTVLDENFLVQPKEEFRKLRFSLRQMSRKIADDREHLQNSVEKLEMMNAELLEKNEMLIRSEKLASVGRLSAGLAHEIGNPLSIVIGYLDMLSQNDLSDEERRIFSQNSVKELLRIQGHIKKLLDFSRSSNIGTQHIHLHSLIHEALELIAAEPRFSEIEMITELTASSDLVVAEWNLMKQVLVNCLFNAADAIREASISKGEISLVTSFDPNDTGTCLLAIQDN